MSLILGHMAYVIRNGRNDASLLNYDIELLAIYDVLLTLVTVVWQKYPEHLTRMTGTLCDGDYFAYTITTSKSTNSDSSVAWKELKSSIATTSPAYRCPENNSPSHEPDKRRASETSENRKRCGISPARTKADA